MGYTQAIGIESILILILLWVQVRSDEVLIAPCRSIARKFRPGLALGVVELFAESEIQAYMLDR